MRVSILSKPVYFERAEDNFFSIYVYATAQTDESVFIIGGYTGYRGGQINIIAEYKDGNWRNAGNLSESRSNFGAITLGSTVMVFGGGG